MPGLWHGDVHFLRQVYDASLDGVIGINGTGLAVHIAPSTWVVRTLQVSGDGLTISNADGALTSPTFSLDPILQNVALNGHAGLGASLAWDASLHTPGTPQAQFDALAAFEAGVAKTIDTIHESFITPAIVVTAFTPATALVLRGVTVNLPAFTASYNAGSVYASGTLEDADNNTPVVVLAGAFSSVFNFTKTTSNALTTFTHDAFDGFVNGQRTTTITWTSHRMHGYGIDPGGPYNQAFIDAISNAGGSTATPVLDKNRNGTWVSGAAGAGEYLWFAVPTSYGDPTFTVGGFEGGFTKVGTAIAYTNANAVAYTYELWRSDSPNLGVSAVVVT